MTVIKLVEVNFGDFKKIDTAKTVYGKINNSKDITGEIFDTEKFIKLPKTQKADEEQEVDNAG